MPTLADVLQTVARSTAPITLLQHVQGGKPGRGHPPLVAPSHHVYYEVAICWGGEMSLVGEEKIYPLAAGDAVVVEPGAWHYETYRKQSQRYDVCWLIVQSNEVSVIFTSYRRGKLEITARTTAPAAAIHSSVQQLAREIADKPSHWAINARSMLLQILVQLDRKTHVAAPSTRSQVDPVEKLLRIVETRFREPLQIKSLAVEAGVSAEHLGRRFKAACGLGFKQYLNALRIHHAKLLLQSGWTVKATADECGFRDVYYFSRAFKTTCHVSPGRFGRQ